METTNYKKRESQELLCTDISTNSMKKYKRQSSEYTRIFLQALSTLPEQKKIIIRKLGFGSILGFSCFSNVDVIFEWLISQFDTSSGTLSLEDRFTFTLSSHSAHMILGFPAGPKAVVRTQSVEHPDFIFNIVKTKFPTVEHLCYLLSTDLDEDSFTVIFMMLLLTAFIDPNASGIPNPAYYANLEDISSIPNLDWCKFTLDCLLRSIEKFLFRKKQNIDLESGGCKILLVISYFEFLITSEFNLGNSLPRLPLWTTHVVNSYIALDSQQGHIKGFGRLSKKHITSTPFKGSKQQMEIPTEIRDYMELKFEGIPLCQEKKRLQSLVSNFFKKMVQNCIPIVKGYVDDIQLVSSSTHKQELEPSFENELHFPAQANKNAIIEESKSEMVVYQQKKKVSEEEMEKFFQNMLFFNQIQVPQDNYDIRSEFHQILHNISERCSLGEQSGGFDLPNLYPEFESSLLYPKGMTSAINVNDTSLQFSEFLKQIKEELSFEIKNQRISYPTMEQDCKFSLQNFEFYLPSEEEPFHGDDDNLHEFFRRPDNILSHNGIISDVTPKINWQTIGQKKVQDDKYVFSLNERLLGKRIPSITDENKGNFPCFNLFEEDNPNMSGHTYSSPGSKLKAIDPLLHMVLDQCGQEILGGQSSIKLKTPFIPSSKLKMQHVQPPQQVIFATALEHEFYCKLTSTKTESSPRIFEIKRVWVDQRTLALSMNTGGWIHPCVMDCYGMLTSTEQIHRRKEGKFGEKEILMHVVIKEVTKLLMDPNLDCSDPEYKRVLSLDYVGYRLENAGLVHIPCPVGKEWILIVANFIDKSFDVLNPDSAEEKFSSVVSTVIFNFKQLFVKCYPGCFKFNIHDFSVKYVHVPKQNFRYDSGIFVIQYIRCYNGVEVQQFSNVDLQAIREKVSCQLVINKFNEQQVPIAREFIAKHAPHLLH